MDYKDIVHATKLSFETTSNFLRKAGMNSAADENDQALSQVLNMIDEPKTPTEPRTCETCDAWCPSIRCGCDWTKCGMWAPKPAPHRPVSADDVECIRDALTYARAWTESISAEYKCGRAIAALDRIAGEEE